MPSHFWYQKTGGEDAWVAANSEYRQKVIADVRPAFVTVLDASDVPNDDWGREDYAKMRYSGPLYFDWDSEDIQETLEAVQTFLIKLEDLGVDPDTLRLYATGGRGFHCEIPEQTFMSKPPRSGTPMLPYIYREMALELITDTMDMRIYTGRKGRMWRTPGVVRTNGRYKVPVSAAQIRAMTPDLYETLTSTPLAAVYAAPPQFSPMLSSMFMAAENDMKIRIKQRAKAKPDAPLLARFNGEFPPTIKNIMNGEGIAPGVGFHKIATQLAITAHAMGKDREEFAQACDGLCKSHQSDSPRYNSPRKRKDELRRMWDYMEDNPAYDYSRGGIKSLCSVDVVTTDLDPPQVSNTGTIQDEGEELPDNVKEELAASDKTLLEGLVVSTTGVYRRSGDGPIRLSNLGFTAPESLIDATSGDRTGVEVNVWRDGQQLGRSVIPMDKFLTKGKLNEFCSGKGGMFGGTDNQASALQVMLTRKAQESGNEVYSINKTGIVILQNPKEKNEENLEVLWVGPETGVYGKTDVRYRYKPGLPSKAVFKTDLAHAEVLTDTPESRALLDALLDMNEPSVMGFMLGWFTAAFHRQHMQRILNEFPLLHPNGPAGSGKSMTVQRMLHMYYNVNDPYTSTASGSTNFPFKCAWTDSASIPFFIDEYKPSEMRADRRTFLLDWFRAAYNQQSLSSGGVSDGSAGSSFRVVSEFTASAPTIYAAEHQELQTAVAQRSVAVAFNKAAIETHKEQYDHVHTNQRQLAHLGKLLMLRTVGSSEIGAETWTVADCRARFKPLREAVLTLHSGHLQERQLDNRAVVLYGLSFLKDALESVFGDVYAQRLDAMSALVLNHRDDEADLAMAEFNKVLNEFAFISRSEDPDSEFAIREGYEYIVEDGFIDIAVKESFVKYFAWCHRKGMESLYPSAPAFMGSVTRSPALMSRAPVGTKLDTSSGTKVFRFNLQKLTADGVESFKSKSLA